MMFRLAQLKEIRHELNRARAIAEEIHLIHLANTLTHNLGTINAEIHELEKQLEPKASPKPTRARKTLEDHTKLEGEDAK